MTIKIIDPHIHLFDLSAGNYDWLKPDNEPFWPDKSKIARSYSDANIQLQSKFKTVAYVHIEAGFDNVKGDREIANTVKRATLPLRSIGCVDITLSPTNFMNALGTQAKHKSAVGIRHILEETTSNNTSILLDLENPHSFTNLAFLESHNGIFELQFDVNNREHVVQVFTFFSRMPKLQLVLNHAGFAPLSFDSNNEHYVSFEDWMINIQLLAKLPNIAVKCSGFEMVDRNYSAAHVKAVIAHCIDTFGIDKVMLASNFPLCELSLSYEDYWLQLLATAGQLTTEHPSNLNKEALYYDNAFRIYQFDTV
jgi:predicted TIM-barrel fold metal-dependent hydrolase